MAKKVILEIDATPIEKATHAISEEEKALARLRAATNEHNKAVKASVEVEKANEILQKTTATSYYEKQKVLTALGKVIRSYVANTDEERAHLESLKNQYADINTELKEFDATMGNHQRNVGNYTESVAKPLTLQLKEMQRAMAEMIVAGKEGSAEYQEMAKEAGRLKDAITDANNEVKRFANDTMVMSDVVDITKSAVGAFGLLQSATALLGVEDENLAKSIQKLQAAQTALNSLQQLQQTYLNKSSGLYKLLNFNIVSYTGASKAATIATKAFNLALKGLGIGLIVGAISFIVDHLKDIRIELGRIIPLLRDEALEMEKVKEMEERRNEKIKERLAYEGKLKDIVNARRILEGESLQVYKEQWQEAQNAQKRVQEVFDNISKNYEKNQKAFAAAYDTTKMQLEEAKLATAQAEKVYKDELKKRKDGEINFKDEKITNLNEIKGAEKGFADYVKGLSDDVAKQRKKDEEEITEKLQKEVQKRIEAQRKADEEEQKRIAEEKEMIVNKSIELQTTAINMISSIFEANAEAIQKNIDAIDKQISRAEKSINRHQNNISNLYQQAALERGAERDALLNAIDEEKKALAQKEKEEQKAQEMKDKAEAKQKKEQFKARKVELANQLLQSIANTALAITKVWADTPTFAAPAMTAIVAAMGAVNQATIVAQMGKLKMANGGLLHGNSHANGGIPVGNTGVEVEGGEYVVNRRSTAAFLPLLEAINERGRRQYADGGQINLPNTDTTADMLSRIDFNPVVSVVDINRVSDRLNTVRVMSN